MGASQVTALLRRVQVDHGRGGYEANFTAWLTESYWVRLADPAELSPSKQAMLAEATGLGDADWLDAVTKARRGRALPVPTGVQQGTLI